MMPNAGEDAEELGQSHLSDGNVKRNSHCERAWQLLKKVSGDLPYDLAIALLGIYA